MENSDLSKQILTETEDIVTEWNLTACGLPEELPEERPINDISHVHKHTKIHKTGLKLVEPPVFRRRSTAAKIFSGEF